MSRRRRRRDRRIPECTIPPMPWTPRTFIGKSTSLLKFVCEQNGIDISDTSVYTNRVKRPYQKAIMKWYKDEYLPSQQQQDEVEDAPGLFHLFFRHSLDCYILLLILALLLLYRWIKNECISHERRFGDKCGRVE